MSIEKGNNFKEAVITIYKEEGLENTLHFLKERGSESSIESLNYLAELELLDLNTKVNRDELIDGELIPPMRDEDKLIKEEIKKEDEEEKVVTDEDKEIVIKANGGEVKENTEEEPKGFIANILNK